MLSSKSKTSATSSHHWKRQRDLTNLERDVRSRDPGYCTRQALEAKGRYGNRDTLRRLFLDLDPIVQWVSLDSYNNYKEDTFSQGRRDELLSRPQLSGIAKLWNSGLFDQ